MMTGKHTEREDMAQMECGGNGLPYYPGDDWGMAERQADDKVRADAKAATRRQRWEDGEGRDKQGNCPAAEIHNMPSGNWRNYGAGNQMEAKKTTYTPRN